MAITVVQSATITGANSGSLPNPTVTGNTVIVAYAGSAGAGSTSTPSVSGVTLGGSADHFSQQIAQNDGNSASCSTVWLDPSCTGGQTALAVSGTSLVAADAFMLALEVSGLGPAPVLDAFSSGPIKAGTQTWTTNVTGLTTSATAICIGVTAHGPNSTSDTLTGPVGWTNAAAFAWSDGAAIAGYLLPSATGNFQYNGTSSDFDYYTSVIAVFKPGGLPFQGPVLVQVPPSWKTAYAHRSRPVLPQPPAPLAIAAADASGTALDAGESIALSDSDSSGPETDSSVITAASADSDAAGQAADTSVITAASADSDASGTALDAGESIAATLPVNPAAQVPPSWTARFRHGERPLVPVAAVPVLLITSSDAGHSTDSGEVIIVITEAAGQAVDGFENIQASLSDSDASGQAAEAAAVTALISDTDASGQAAEAAAVAATVTAADASAPAQDAGERLLVNPSAVPGRAQPGAAWQSRFGHRRAALPLWAVSPVQFLADTDASTGTDAGAPLGAVDADLTHAEDSGFTFLADADASHARDTEVPLAQADTDLSICADVELTAWPRDTEASTSADTGTWSGPLADTDTGHGIEAVLVYLADTEASTGTESHVVGVYSFQPPFRWTGGGYEIVHSGRVIVTGTVPSRRELELAQDLAAAREVRFPGDSDRCTGTDRHGHALVHVQVQAGALAVAVSWEVS